MKKFLSFLAALFAPVAAFAQVPPPPTPNTQNVYTLLQFVQQILNTVIPIVITLGVIFFIWEVFKYVTAGDEEERAKAKGLLIYAIIGIFLVVSIWGIVAWLQNTLGVAPSAATNLCLVDSDPLVAGCQP